MTFKCRENCGLCCGPVLIPKTVYEKYKDTLPLHKSVEAFEDDVIIVTENASCVFLSEDKKCKIYDERPEVCKIYGNSETAWKIPSLMCPFFRPDGSPRNRAERRQVDRYIKNTFEQMQRRLQYLERNR
jgi:Fe-S-cluster containining protein